MLRNLILSTVSAGALLVSAPVAPAKAAVSADINIHIGERYPHAYFVREPRAILIPDSRVYYVSGYDDYDLYRCDGWWYLVDDGYWYRARSYRGPFIGISFELVPRYFWSIPVAYRHEPFRPRYVQTRWRDDHYRSYSHRTYDRDWSWDRDRSSYRDRDWDRNRDGGRKVLNVRDRDRDRDREWRNDDDRGKNKGKGNKGRGHGRSHGRGRGNK